MVAFDQLPADTGLYSAAEEKDACGVGFIADLTGRQSAKVVRDGLVVLERMEHRGACGCEVETGDGAGICVGMPRAFVKNVCAEIGIAAAADGLVAVGNVFFRRGEVQLKEAAIALLEAQLATVHCSIAAWRKVPVNSEGLGKSALDAEPEVQQVFVVPNDLSISKDAFEAKLFLARKRTSHLASELTKEADAADEFITSGPMYFCSLSSKTLVYKGMLRTHQVSQYYPDILRNDFATHVVSVHSRFSTNTFPAWSRAHPYRFLCHNGEINTLMGNRNWMAAREGQLDSELLGAELKSALPVVEAHNSDSQTLDNVLELLVRSGRSLPESVLMMVPEAWQNNPVMDQSKRDFYKYNSSIMEPWDGPALVLFNDGDSVGAVLDRNGLRPCRYYVTKDDMVVCASEAGVLPEIPPQLIRAKGRLQPGKMLLADISQGRIIDDQEIKSRLAQAKPYGEWIARQSVSVSQLTEACKVPFSYEGVEKACSSDEHVYLDWEEDAIQRLKAFGYSVEHLELLLRPMANDGMEALGSMGNDAPLAFLSETPRTVFDYFKQLFAQVTNPPVDPIREAVVMSCSSYIGPERNLLAQSEDHVNRLFVENPFLTRSELHAVEHTSIRGWRSKLIDITHARSDGPSGLKTGIDRVCQQASEAIKEGYEFIILSDRSVSFERVRISGLMAVAAVHQYLVKKSERTQIGIILESGEPREVHHMCCLFGYGVDAVCPYMAFEACLKLRHDAKLKADITNEQIERNLTKAYYKGMLKVMAKMGISTLQSYKGAQIFEAVGLGSEVVELCFTGTASRVGGATFQLLGKDTLCLHEQGFPRRPSAKESVAGLGNFGEYHWRAGSGTESHINDPAAIAQLQVAARTDSVKAYKQFSKLHDEAIRHSTLRGLLQFKSNELSAVSIDKVEPAASIVKRFRTGAMSYGSISIETHVALARAMNRIGAKSNSGEGGEDVERFTAEVGGDRTRSSIKQVASGRFGVTIEYLSNADEIQIKMAQGAKPGEGGELPGWKVSEDIAKTRHSTPGVGLISPPPHHDIYSIEDLAQLIYDLKNSNPSSNVSVKLVSKLGVGVIASGVAKGKADHILISGHDGGTGASRWTGIKHAGLPWELGISETHQTLVMNGLRGRVSLETDGHLRTGRDVAVAAMLGAEHFGFGTAPLITMGCIMMRKCHLNTCPVGVATQDPELRAKFKGEPEHLVNYLFLVAEELREIMASLGVTSMNQLIGRTDLLRVNEDLMAQHGDRLGAVDLSKLLRHANTMTSDVTRHENRKLYKQDHELDRVLDRKIFQLVSREMTRAMPKRIELPVCNTDRSVGAILSHEVAKVHGSKPMADGTLHVKLTGTAGQSVGAWLSRGIAIEVEGDANDYAGKGLSGGLLAVYPSKLADFKAEDQVIVGNVALYGATSGRAFFSGKSAERFAVRNSGAYTVIEGVGDHGCEYMTGGRVVILGKTGINFAAGMSGGLAYVYNPDGDFEESCNKEIVDIDAVDAGSIYERELRSLIEEHVKWTGSVIGTNILCDWESARTSFALVFPRDYKRVLEEQTAKETETTATPPPQITSPTTTTQGSPAQNSSPVMSDIEDLGGQNTRPVVVDTPVKRRGFVEYERGAAGYRDASERLEDFTEIYEPHDHKKLNTQAARCMDCGIPFCQSGPGCPLGNKIPEWNELVYNNKWKEALERLLHTNNFPEFTGRVCPAPCEGSCCLGVIENPVTIKNIECAIIDHAFEQGWMVPQPPTHRTGKRIAIVGSGPAGMAAADQLNKAGHWVTVYERADRIGGLMTYGVPNMKADKLDIVQRRVDLMADEGVKFVTGSAGNVCGTEWFLSVEKGTEAPTQAKELMNSFDAVLLSTGAVVPRDLKIPGRELNGVHFAMEFLTKNTKALLDSDSVSSDWRAKATGKEFIDAKGKKVVVIGGGDTGNDCIGTSMRHGATSVVNFELLPQPPAERAASNPWPEWPKIYRVDYGHEEVSSRDGKDPREFLICSKEFISDGHGNLSGIRTVRVDWTKDERGAFKMNEVPGSEQVFEADLCFLAMGFLGPQKDVGNDVGIELDTRGNFKADFGRFKTSIDKVFAAGDCRRGQSLVVWAIAEGRQAAREIDRFLMGDTLLP